MDPVNSINKPQKLRTEDGYTFYRSNDGRYANSQGEDCIDMYCGLAIPK